MAATLRSLSAQHIARTAIHPRIQASAFATSSRVGLDFTLPARAAAAASSTAAASSSSSSAAQTPPPTTSSPTATAASSRKGAPKIRWEPLSPEPWLGVSGLVDRAPTHTLTVTSSRNNVHLTFADRVGPLFPTITGGTGKVFKKSARSSYEAAHQAALKMFAKVTESSREWAARRGSSVVAPGALGGGVGSSSGYSRKDGPHIIVAYSGMFGQGREAVNAAIAGPEGAELRAMICRVEDRTPIKIGGTRARKARRL